MDDTEDAGGCCVSAALCLLHARAGVVSGSHVHAGGRGDVDVNSTPHLARAILANTFSRLAQDCIVCVISKRVILTGAFHIARAMVMATLPFLYCTTLRLYPILRTGVFPAIRNNEFRLVILPNRAQLQLKTRFGQEAFREAVFLFSCGASPHVLLTQSHHFMSRVVVCLFVSALV